MRVIHNRDGACYSVFIVFSYEILHSKKVENAKKTLSIRERMEASWFSMKKGEETVNTDVSTSSLGVCVPTD